MSQVAKITPSGAIIRSHRAKGVTDDNGIQHPMNIFTLWSDDELNAIGYARFNNPRVPASMVSTGYTDVFSGGQVTREHTLVPYVAPVVPDATPTYVAEDGDMKRSDPLDPLSEMVPAIVGETLVNESYDHSSEREKYYPSQADMIVALWEAVVEGRPSSKDALEVLRQATKARFPKPTEGA